MKAKVIIENGKSKIILTPENNFEKTMVEDLHNSRNDISVNTEVEYNLGRWDKHKLIVTVKNKDGL